MNDEYEKFNLIGIDAWRDDCGWTWNNHFILEHDICFGINSLTPRKILAALRKWGYLSEYSKGKVRIDNSINECLVIENRNTGEPVLALSQLHGG